MARRHFAVDQNRIHDNKIVVKLGAFRPRFAKGDAVLIYKKKKTDVTFTATSKIEEAQTQQDGNSEVQTSVVAAAEDFKEERDLDVLAGSLEKIKRFVHPYRHFQRGFLSLSEADFKAIVENSIDIDRTIFRYLFSSLPFQVQADFISTEFSEEAIDPEGRVRNYAILREKLINYFNHRIEPIMRLLDNFETTYSKLKGVRRLPSIQKLQFFNLQTRDAVAFGSIARRFRDVAENSLFSEKTATPRLLSEARVIASEEADAIQGPAGKSRRTTKVRKWNETIF